MGQWSFVSHMFPSPAISPSLCEEHLATHSPVPLCCGAHSSLSHQALGVGLVDNTVACFVICWGASLPPAMIHIPGASWKYSARGWVSHLLWVRMGVFGGLPSMVVWGDGPMGGEVWAWCMGLQANGRRNLAYVGLWSY